jgi:hypothetical protein
MICNRAVPAQPAAAAVAALALGLLLGSPGSAAAQTGTFGTPYTCQLSGRLSQQQCSNAFANTRAELGETSPRFPTRKACEEHFARCSILDILGGRKVTFGPTQEGIEVVRNGGRLMALPVVTAKGPRPMFRPRPVDERAVQESPQRRAQAQAAWKAQLDAAAAPPPDVDGAAVLPAEPYEPYDPNWQKQEGVATYPGKRKGKAGSAEVPASGN